MDKPPLMWFSVIIVAQQQRKINARNQTKYAQNDIILLQF